MAPTDPRGEAAPQGAAADTPIEALRRRELEAVRGWFEPGMRVLELGGRSGFHAAMLASWGCRVTSIDVAVPGDGRRYFPVELYDGRHVPRDDGSFDTVYTSHMLYHVLDAPEFFSEIRRVLVAGGLAIHLMPSVGWRVATALGHYPHVLRRLASRRARPPVDDAAPVPGGEGQEGLGAESGLRRLAHRARAALVPPPLRPGASVLAEALGWRRSSMVERLRSYGFETVATVPTRVFYTPYEFLGTRLSPSVRSRLSAPLGSSSVAYVTRRSPAAG